MAYELSHTVAATVVSTALARLTLFLTPDIVVADVECVNVDIAFEHPAHSSLTHILNCDAVPLF